MNPINKIYLAALTWLVLTFVVFSYLFPHFSQSLITLQQSHQEQISQLDSLKTQALGLQKMQDDLQQVDNQPVKLGSFFTSDINLVKEIQRIEDISQKTNIAETLQVTGTVDKALPASKTSSGLFLVPYTLALNGSFPEVLNFLKYFENSYFISPLNAITVSYVAKGSVNATILSNFIIHK